MKTKNLPGRLLWVFILLYTAFFSYICLLKYNSFAYNDFDLAIDAQTVWNILHGSMYSSIHQMNFLGNHVRLILFLAAPLYAIFTSPYLLLFLQTAVLALGAYPVYKLASQELNDKLGLAFGFAYLFYPAVGYLNLFEFHPVAFTATFFLYALYYLRQDKFYRFLLFLILAMLCQENIPLIVIMMGGYAMLLKKPLRWKALPIILGIGYFYAAVFMIHARFNSDTIQFTNLYGAFGDSLPEVFKNILLNPVTVLKTIIMPQKLAYLFTLLAPLLFLPLLSPAGLLMALPVFLQHFLSSRPTETMLWYHYSAEFIPFLFYSAIFGAKRAFSFKILKRENFLLLFLIVVVASNVTLGPHLHEVFMLGEYKKDIADFHKEKLLAMIPPDAPVVATFEFLPRLSNRPFVYSFHHVYSGYHTLSRYGEGKRKYVLPEHTTCALIDFNEPNTFSGFYNEESSGNLRRFLEGGDWGVSYLAESICLFRKDPALRRKLYNISTSRPAVQYKSEAELAKGIGLMGCSVNFIQDDMGSWADFVFAYKCTAPPSVDLGVMIALFDSEGRKVRRMAHSVCYGAYTTDKWSPGRCIEERYRFLLSPDNTPMKKGVINVGFYDIKTGKTLYADKQKKESCFLCIQFDL